MCALGLTSAFAGWTALVLAQTGVTLYGRVASGIDYQNNVAPTATASGGNLWHTTDNQWGTSMFGFMGKEDLGGGLQVMFRLESDFGVAQSKANDDALFNRRSYVGLSNPVQGTPTAGKNLLTGNDIWFLDPTDQQFIGSATLMHGCNWSGANNIVKYQNPTWGGLQIGLQAGLGEQPGSSANGRRDDASAVYSAGPLEVRAIYDVIHNDNDKLSDIFNFSEEVTLSGTYTIDKAELLAAYENLSAPDVAVGVPTKANYYWLGVSYETTSTLMLIGAAYRMSVNHGGSNTSLFMVGVDYSLSRRMILYTSVGTVQNSTIASLSVRMTNNNPAPGKDRLGAYTGIARSLQKTAHDRGTHPQPDLVTLLSLDDILMSGGSGQVSLGPPAAAHGWS